MRASVTDRAGAFFLDEVIIFMISLVISIIVAFNTNEYTGRYCLSLMILAGILLKDITGQSLGKKIFRLKVVMDDGSRAPWYKLILRNITDFAWYIELLFVLASDSRTRLTDKLLHLKVIKRSKLS